MNIAGAQVKASPDEVERMLKDIIDQEYQEETQNEVILLEDVKALGKKRDRS